LLAVILAFVGVGILFCLRVYCCLVDFEKVGLYTEGMYYIVQSQETLEYLYSEQSDNNDTPKWTWEFGNAKHFDSFSSAASEAVNQAPIQTPVIISVAKANSVIWGVHYLDSGTV
jgi:hypothetical protein